MEQYLPIVFIAVIAVLGYLTSEYLRLMKCVRSLETLLAAVQHAHNSTTWVVSELVPPEEENLKEDLMMVITEDSFRQ